MLREVKEALVSLALPVSGMDRALRVAHHVQATGWVSVGGQLVVFPLRDGACDRSAQRLLSKVQEPLVLLVPVGDSTDPNEG